MKTIIITGGSSGIGQAAALLFASRGWRVHDLSRSSGCDVTSPEQCQAAVGRIIASDGRIDVLICNAGMGISGPLEFATSEDTQRLMDVNVHGAMNVIQAVLPQMRSQHSGRIIIVSSVAGVFSIPYQGWYSASKAALNALAAALRNEVREQGISVCCLQPGDVRTGFTAARQKSVSGADVYPHAERSVAVMERDEQHGLAPETIACQLWHLANSRHVNLYYVAGWKYKLLCFIARFIPATLVNKVVGWMY